MSVLSRRLIAIMGLVALLTTATSVTAGSAFAATNVVVAVTAPSGVLAPTTPFTSSVTVTNTGDTDAASFTFVAGFPRFTSTTPHPARVITLKNGVTCTTYTPRYGSSRKTCTVPALAAGATLEVMTVTMTPPVLAPFPYVGVTTSFSVTGPTNSTGASFAWRQASPPNLSPSTPFVTPGTALAGSGPVTVSGTISNAAYGAAGPFGWHLSLPTGATNGAQSVTIAGTVCGPAGDGFDCLTPALANGASLAYGFTFTAPTLPGSYPAAITVDTGNLVAESNEADNAATSTPLTVPGAAANLRISATNPATVGQYSTFTRTVTVVNIGGSDAANIAFNDYAAVGPFEVFSFASIPAGTTCGRYVTFSGRPSTAHYHGVRCTIGTIPAGGSVAVPYDLVVKNNAVNTYTSTLTASTTSYVDPSSTPTGSVSTTVFVPSPVNPPLNTVVPVVTGNANTGSVLTTTSGTWIGAGTIAFAYQWQRCNVLGLACSDILGATTTTHVVDASDVGATLRASVTATNLGGTRTGVAAPTAIVVGAVSPTNTVAPNLIAGLEKQPGFAWGVGTGTWSGTPTITYAYQWMRCAVGGGGCVDIAGATSSSYVLQTDDVFHSVQVRVVATNPAGSGTAFSDVSPEIDPLG